ncbi:ABC transporter substrate-binding protein [Streptomyces sp. NPDC047009]|uniref:ABC transporter substrate-binding protein n=1 Tax=unclassified Streptomyces TaxID=2593676 RepID=UPI0033E8143C
MSLHRRSRRCLTAAISSVLLLAGSLTACGGNSSASGSSLPTVTIGKAVDTIGFSTIDVAEKMGYFKDAGVNVKTEQLQGSSQTTAALQGGSIQFATLSSTALLLASSKGVKLQAIASLDHGVSVQIVTTKDWDGKRGIAPNQPLSQRMKGLEGAKDAAISSTGTSVLKLMMKQNGADPGKVDFVTVGSDAAGSAALGHGTLQVFVGSPPSTYYMVDHANSEIIANATEVPAMKTMAYDIAITNPSWAQAHKSEAKGVATALARAENLMATNPDKVIALEQKHFPSYSKDELMKSLKSVQWTTNGTFTQAMWDDAVKVSQEMGQLSGSVDAKENGLWTNQYLDTAAMSASGSN